MEGKITNNTIKEKTKFPDALQKLKSSKWKWAGHSARAIENWANNTVN